MAYDPLSELRNTISDQLQRFWPSAEEATRSVQANFTEETPAPESTPTPGTKRSANTRYGIRNPAPANALREDVAAEIAAMLQRNPTWTENLDSIASTNLPTVGGAKNVNNLPLGARLRTRGIFEDDWAARTDANHPWPVILLHGTVDSKGVWQLLGNELRQDGWAVFAPDYGIRATGLIPDSAAQVGAYIDAVLAVTGAEKVIVIGHSQGGVIARYWMRHGGGADKMKHLICLGSPNHGTTQGGIISPLIASRVGANVMQYVIDAYFGPAGAQQLADSPIIHSLNEGGELEEGVTYTNIATKSDTVVVPPETCFLAPDEVKDGTVRNIYVQDFDRRAVVLHHDMPVDKRVRAITRTILRQLKP